jgi:hypothetical protein
LAAGEGEGCHTEPARGGGERKREKEEDVKVKELEIVESVFIARMLVVAFVQTRLVAVVPLACFSSRLVKIFLFRRFSSRVS